MDSVVFPYKEEEDLKNKIVYYEASRGVLLSVSIVCLPHCTGKIS